MKLLELLRLAEAAELGLPYLRHQHARQDLQAAIDAAHFEARRRMQLREFNRAHRPSRTIRREAIRDQLLLTHHKARLTRDGHWHVQVSPGSSWLLFALDDNDAENMLNS